MQEAYKENEKFKKWCDDNPKSFKNSSKIEGLQQKYTGVHLLGLLFHIITLMRYAQFKNPDGDLITGYDMNYVAELMVKFDVLGLRTLMLLTKLCHRLNIDMESINLDDQSLYENLKALKTPQGLFQIEADTNFRVCKKVRL